MFGERAMQPDIRLDHLFAQQRIRGQPNARRARGMGAAWPNHHGTYQVEQIHAFHAFPGKRFLPYSIVPVFDDFAMDIRKKNAPLHNVLPVQQGYLY